MDDPSAIDCAVLLAAPGREPAAGPVRLSLRAGRVAGLAALPEPPPGPRRLLMPALVNAHDHARTLRSASLGAFGQPLETWLPFMGVPPGADPYLCAATAFARSVRHGVSHAMVHYTRVQGGLAYPDEVRAVARAARDVGLRIGFAVAMRDRQGLALCDDATALAAIRPALRDEARRRLSTPAEPAADQLARVDAVAAALASEPGVGEHVTLQYGPTGVQWCSDPLLRGIAARARESGRPVHMHLLETRYQRQWADRAYPQGIVAHLDALGLLGPWLTLAHCVWARPDELAQLADRGVTIAVSTSSNLGLKSGVAPVGEMLRRGCRVAMGLDGMAFDEDDDALREMRLLHALHRGWGFDVDMTPAQLWDVAARNGRRTVTGQGDDGGGAIVAGAPADLLALDLDALDDDALFPAVDPLHLLLARGRGGLVDALWVGGRPVVAGGRVLGVDEPALKAALHRALRAAIAADGGPDAWRMRLTGMAEDLGPFYRSGAFLGGCC